MTNPTSTSYTDPSPSAQTALDRRSQTRVAVRSHVQLERTGGEERLIARNQNLSWGGASLVLPREACVRGDTVILELPWAQGESFRARAEVVRAQAIDDQHALVGVRFSELLVGDEEKLQRLLGMLLEPRKAEEQSFSVADRLEMYFIDREDMYTTLTEIRSGRMEVTSFRPYELNQSIAFAVARAGQVPVLRLRARVEQQRAIKSAEDKNEPQVFRVALAFEHPLDDLKQAVDPLIERLVRKRREALDSAA